MGASSNLLLKCGVIHPAFITNNSIVDTEAGWRSRFAGCGFSLRGVLDENDKNICFHGKQLLRITGERAARALKMINQGLPVQEKTTVIEREVEE